MARNRRDEEIGGKTYYLFTLALLRRSEGIVTGAKLEAAIKARFSRLWGPEDRRIVRGQRAKWQNMIDWAKVVGTRNGTFFNRSRVIDGQKVTFIVMPSVCANKPLVKWVKRKKKGRGFRQTCCECGYRNAMGVARCVGCGAAFRVPAKKVQVPIAT